MNNALSLPHSFRTFHECENHVFTFTIDQKKQFSLCRLQGREVHVPNSTLLFHMDTDRSQRRHGARENGKWMDKKDRMLFYSYLKRNKEELVVLNYAKSMYYHCLLIENPYTMPVSQVAYPFKTQPLAQFSPYATAVQTSCLDF